MLLLLLLVSQSEAQQHLLLGYKPGRLDTQKRFVHVQPDNIFQWTQALPPCKLSWWDQHHLLHGTLLDDLLKVNERLLADVVKRIKLWDAAVEARHGVACWLALSIWSIGIKVQPTSPDVHKIKHVIKEYLGLAPSSWNMGSKFSPHYLMFKVEACHSGELGLAPTTAQWGQSSAYHHYLAAWFKDLYLHRITQCVVLQQWQLLGTVWESTALVRIAL